MTCEPISGSEFSVAKVYPAATLAIRFIRAGESNSNWTTYPLQRQLIVRWMRGRIGTSYPPPGRWGVAERTESRIEIRVRTVHRISLGYSPRLKGRGIQILFCGHSENIIIGDQSLTIYSYILSSCLLHRLIIAAPNWGLRFSIVYIYSSLSLRLYYPLECSFYVPLGLSDIVDLIPYLGPLNYWKATS